MTSGKVGILAFGFVYLYVAYDWRNYVYPCRIKRCDQKNSVKNQCWIHDGNLVLWELLGIDWGRVGGSVWDQFPYHRSSFMYFLRPAAAALLMLVLSPGLNDWWWVKWNNPVSRYNHFSSIRQEWNFYDSIAKKMQDHPNQKNKKIQSPESFSQTQH